MAQQHTPRAEAKPGTDRTDFLSGLNANGFKCTSPALGHDNTDTSVCVFDDTKSPHTVMLVLRNGAFAAHNLLSPDEARTLASALTMAAGHADSIQLQKTHAEWAAAPADEVTG